MTYSALAAEFEALRAMLQGNGDLALGAAPEPRRPQSPVPAYLRQQQSDAQYEQGAFAPENRANRWTLGPDLSSAPVDLAMMAMSPGLAGFALGMTPTPAYGNPPAMGRKSANPDEMAEYAAKQEGRRAAEPDLIAQALSALRGPDFAPMPKESFRKDYMTRDPFPTPQSEDEFARAAGDRVRASDSYKKLLEMGAASKANKTAQQAEAEARKSYQGYSQRGGGAIADWEKRAEQAYDAYTQDLEGKRTAHNNKSFAERNPTAAGLLTYGPLALGAIGARKAFKRYNEAGDVLINGAKAARATGSAADEAAAALALNKWRNQDYYTTVAKTAGKVAGGSVAGRGLMDLTDRYLMPEGSGAREKVKNKYTADNLPNLAVEYGTNLLAGIEAPAVGAMMTRGGPRSEARAYTAMLDPRFADTVRNVGTIRAAAAARQQAAAGEANALAGVRQQGELSEARHQAMVDLLSGKLPKARQDQLLDDLLGAPRAQPAIPAAGAAPTPAGPPAVAPGGPTVPQRNTTPPPQHPREAAYLDPQKSVVRPLVESEIAAGRSVPDWAQVSSALQAAGVKIPGQEGMRKKLDNASALTDNLRQSGLSDDKVAKILADLMRRNTPVFPALAGAAAAGGALYGIPGAEPFDF